MKTLKLFNAVVAKKSNGSVYISRDGYIIEPGALWAQDRIIEYYEKEKLDGSDLNKTFHKSWAKIRDTPRYELLTDQITHYLSTYGSNFQNEIYIPDEILNIPDTKIMFKIIKSYSREQMTEKCLDLLKSGIALKEETINNILAVLVDELNYQFTGQEGIRNKEAVIKIADMYGIIPVDTMEFFRYIIYKATGESLLIKNKEIIEVIGNSNFNPAPLFQQHGFEKLSEIYNRYKPLFLAFKPKCSKTINRISKLSKKYHKPMAANPLNAATSRLLNDSTDHWMDNATPYALFKALSACYTRMNGQDSFVYRIRNGKSWTMENKTSDANKQNYEYLLNYITDRFDLSGKKIYLPKDIKYALPTSEKMYVGSIPTGTRFYGEKLAIGIYWEDAWGASDLDLSGINIGGKIGWNAAYSQGGQLMYSGDITSAPKGAVEYLYANKGLGVPTLVKCNVYSGEPDCYCKIIVGRGDKVSKKYMMNPDNLFAEIKCQSLQKQMILGMIIPKRNEQCFTILNFGAGHTRVSGKSTLSNIATRALYQQWNKPLSFNKIVKLLGAEITEEQEKADYNYSLESLGKDSFIQLFR